MHQLTQLLAGLTHGEGVAEAASSHFAPVTAGPVPTRARTDDNPYRRVDFLRAVSQRVALRR